MYKNSSQIVITDISTPKFFTGRMPFLSPSQQYHSIEGRAREKQNDSKIKQATK